MADTKKLQSTQNTSTLSSHRFLRGAFGATRALGGAFAGASMLGGAALVAATAGRAARVRGTLVRVPFFIPVAVVLLATLAGVLVVILIAGIFG